MKSVVPPFGHFAADAAGRFPTQSDLESGPSKTASHPAFRFARLKLPGKKLCLLASTKVVQEKPW